MIATALVIGWPINILIEGKDVRQRTPSAAELFISFCIPIAGVFGAYLLVKYRDRLTKDDGTLEWFVGPAFVIVLGALLEVIMSARAAGTPVDKIPLYDPTIASVIAVLVFFGFWAELDGESRSGTIPLAATAGYGRKGIFSDAKRDLCARG